MLPSDFSTKSPTNFQSDDNDITYKVKVLRKEKAKKTYKNLLNVFVEMERERR